MDRTETEFYMRVGGKISQRWGTERDIRKLERWAAILVGAELLQEQIDPDVVAKLVSDALRTAKFGTYDFFDAIQLSDEIHQKLISKVREAGFTPPQMLIEFTVKTPTPYRMFIFTNESKHAGRPHVVVCLGAPGELDKRVTISICENPEILSGKRKLHGVQAALRAVRECHVELLCEWNNSRPDDQKIKIGEINKCESHL